MLNLEFVIINSMQLLAARHSRILKEFKEEGRVANVLTVITFCYTPLASFNGFDTNAYGFRMRKEIIENLQRKLTDDWTSTDYPRISCLQHAVRVSGRKFAVTANDYDDDNVDNNVDDHHPLR
jgi:hypothetical protein